MFLFLVSYLRPCGSGGVGYVLRLWLLLLPRLLLLLLHVSSRLLDMFHRLKMVLKRGKYFVGKVFNSQSYLNLLLMLLAANVGNL